MLRTITAFVISFMVMASANAKTPPEVLSSYKAYKTALDAKDYDTAADHAFDAWQKLKSSWAMSKQPATLRRITPI